MVAARVPRRVGTMLMAPPPTARAIPFLRRRWFCRHRDITYETVWVRGEKWRTFIYYCRRCHRIVGPSHAAKTKMPVTQNE
jgi:hypothetical protein